jgi:uncharacterized protein (TIGR02145 family)
MNNKIKRIFLTFLLIAVIGGISFSQTITLTFTAQDANKNYIQLNRVVVTNLSRGWSETLIYPDTILIMENCIGIDEYDKPTTFLLSQNIPNPFDGVTDFSLQLPEQEMVYASVVDLNGKTITSLQSQMSRGTHTFRVYLSTPSTYVLNVKAGSDHASIKMVNTGFTFANQINLLTSNNNLKYELKAGKGETNNPFIFGDMMEYVGYAVVNGQEYESERIVRQQGSSQTYILNFSTVEQHYIPIVQTQSVDSITDNSAYCSVAIVSNGGAEITSQGVCWATSPLPTINDFHSVATNNDETFTCKMESLSSGETYYVRGYAINEVGIGYGEPISFTTRSLTIPVVTTDTPVVIHNRRAVVGGTILDNGGVKIEEKGICYALSDNPTYNSLRKTSDSENDVFQVELADLLTDTLYYARAYAMNSVGIAYGDVINFRVLSSRPFVKTIGVDNIENKSAIVQGKVEDDGGSPITGKGFCWDMNSNPSIENASIIYNNENENNFSNTIRNLTEGVTYYVRAFAENSKGISYGEQIMFTTKSIPVDKQSCLGPETVNDYEGNAYKTVSIGNQCWLQENIRAEFFSNGTHMSVGVDNTFTSFVEHYSAYEFFYLTESTYAGNPQKYTDNLYNWCAAVNKSSSSANNPSGIQGICPIGWHIPSQQEWVQLIDYVGSNNDYRCDIGTVSISKALASNNDWGYSETTCSIGNDLQLNNATHFTARPVGYVDWDSTSHYDNQYQKITYKHSRCKGQGGVARFWTSTESNAHTAYVMELTGSSAYVTTTSGYAKYTGAAVRCLRDEISDYSVFPIVQTTPVDSVMSSSAACGGKIVDRSDMVILSRGVCFSTSPNPTLQDKYTVEGGGSGTFSSNVMDLQPNTTYYVRAYATYRLGTTYGNEYQFTTLKDFPLVTTDTVVLSLSHTSVLLSGKILSNGGDSITEIGICWSLNPNPTIHDFVKTSDSIKLDDFSVEVDNLGPNTYYARAYAINSVGEGYGDVISFTIERILPIVTTADVTDIQYNKATCGGTVIDMGPHVTARGVCWSTKPNPTIADDHTADSIGWGTFTSAMSVLYHKTTYYVRAYATNSDGTSYGEEKSFTTLVGPLSSVSIIDRCVGEGVINVTCTCWVSDDNYPVTARGICWNTSSDPTLDDEHTTDGSGSGTFISEVKNIPANTDIYVSAYSTNDGGTTYSGSIRLNTYNKDGQACMSGATVSDRDGNTYNTVQIGEQCWMKENLKTTKYADGTSIAQGSTTSFDVAYWYYPDNNESNKVTYGLLYNWKAVMGTAFSSNTNPSGVQGICPTGWHVPSVDEWNQLTDYVSSRCQYRCNPSVGYIAKALASSMGWESSTKTCAVGNVQSENNATGFSALPAGGFGDNYTPFGGSAYYWSATELYSGTARGFFLKYDSQMKGSYSAFTYKGCSVRCLRD